MPTSMTLGGNLISSCISSWRTFSGSQSQKASHLGRSRCIFYSTSHTRRHISTSRPTFPCVEAHADRESRLLSANSSSQSNLASRDPSSSGPEPAYARPSPQSYKLYQHQSPLALVYNASLPSFDIAYETWGTLSASKDNAILIHTGLSASSHAASTPLNHDEGWWENFIGPGRALDTNDYYIICTNILGGCYGSTGPSSVDPTSGQRYGTNFPVISIFDMVRAQFCLLDYLGINRLYASVGCSMGGMQSLAAGWLFPDRVRKIVSISGTARTSPSSIAIRFAQRSVLMADPNWNSGFYYEGLPPHTGMKLARQIATITYRSGPEWEQRFGRSLRPPDTVDNDTLRTPALCPDFLIETYLDHQGEQFCLKYDANSLIYISKAMDLFDLSQSALAEIGLVSESKTKSPDETFRAEDKPLQKPHPPPANPPRHLDDLADGMQPLSDIPTLVLGVQSDVLFPVDQQREVADALRMIGNREVRYYELGGVWGHDTFLLDVQNVGGAIRGFLS